MCVSCSSTLHFVCSTYCSTLGTPKYLSIDVLYSCLGRNFKALYTLAQWRICIFFFLFAVFCIVKCCTFFALFLQIRRIVGVIVFVVGCFDVGAKESPFFSMLSSLKC